MPPEKEKETVVENVEEKVKEIVLSILDVKPEDIVPTAKIVDDLKATSIDIVEIVTALQNAFNVNVTDEEAGKIETVQDAMNVLNAAIAKKEAKA